MAVSVLAGADASIGGMIPLFSITWFPLSVFEHEYMAASPPNSTAAMNSAMVLAVFLILNSTSLNN